MESSITLDRDSAATTEVPCGLQNGMIEDYHGGIMGGYFSGPKVYMVMSRHWWWKNMYQDIVKYTSSLYSVYYYYWVRKETAT